MARPQWAVTPRGRLQNVAAPPFRSPSLSLGQHRSQPSPVYRREFPKLGGKPFERVAVPVFSFAGASSGASGGIGRRKCFAVTKFGLTAHSFGSRKSEVRILSPRLGRLVDSRCQRVFSIDVASDQVDMSERFCRVMHWTGIFHADLGNLKWSESKWYILIVIDHGHRPWLWLAPPSGALG